MSADPRVSRFSDDSDQSLGKEPQQTMLPTQDKETNKNSNRLRQQIPHVAKLAAHPHPECSKANDDRDKHAVQSYADYICSYNEWKIWLAKLDASEDQLEKISLQLEHFAGDAIMQNRVLGQWRSERLRWHDLTRLTYISLHKCAFHMTEYHNILTEVYNERDSEAERLSQELKTVAQELKDANKLIKELSAKLKNTNDSARSLVLEVQTVQRPSQQSFQSPVALTESWDNLDAAFEGTLDSKGSEVSESGEDILTMTP